VDGHQAAVKEVRLELTQPEGTRFTVWPGSPAPALLLDAAWGGVV